MTRRARTPAEVERLRWRLRAYFAALCRVLDGPPLRDPAAPMRAAPRQLMRWYRMSAYDGMRGLPLPPAPTNTEGGHAPPSSMPTEE